MVAPGAPQFPTKFVCACKEDRLTNSGCADAVIDPSGEFRAQRDRRDVDEGRHLGRRTLACRSQQMDRRRRRFLIAHDRSQFAAFRSRRDLVGKQGIFARRFAPVPRRLSATVIVVALGCRRASVALAIRCPRTIRSHGRASSRLCRGRCCRAGRPVRRASHIWRACSRVGARPAGARARRARPTAARR